MLTKTKSDFDKKKMQKHFFGRWGGGENSLESSKAAFQQTRPLVWDKLLLTDGWTACGEHVFNNIFYTHTDSQRVMVSTYHKGALFTTSCIQMTHMSWFQMDLDASGSLLAARQERSSLVCINPSSPNKRTNSDGRNNTFQIWNCRFEESIIL